MSAQIVNLNNAPNQLMAVSLQLSGKTVRVQVELSWNRIGSFWVASVYDQAGNPLVTSLPLLTGDWPAGNLMAPFDYLGIGTWCMINQNGAATDWPNAQNLGVGFVLLVDDNKPVT